MTSVYCKKCKKEIPEGSMFCNLCGARQTPKKRAAHKRAAGTGSITKLSGNRKKPYQAQIRTQIDADGHTRRSVIGTFATYADAQTAIATAGNAATSAPVNDYIDFTLSQIFEEYKKTRDYKDLSHQTQDNYNAAFKYLSPFHGWKFRELRRPQFQQAVDSAEAAGRSHSTMEKIKVVSTILSDFAVENDIIVKSYAKGVRLPSDTKKKAPEYFSDIEVSKIEKHLNDPDIGEIVEMIVTMIYTGMRISEQTRLTKFDVNLKERLITGGVKTEAGKNRIIPIHKKILPIITRRYAACQQYLFEETVGVGNKKHGTYQVVQKPYRYEHFCDLYFSALDRIGVRRLTPHKARHTFFTMIDAKCADKLAISMIGGHSDPDFTAKTYVHPDVERLRNAIDCL